MATLKYFDPNDQQWKVLVSGVSDHGALTGLADDDHTQYAIIVVSATEPVSPRVGTIWVPAG